MYVSTGGTATVDGATILANQANFGGGMYVAGSEDGLEILVTDTVIASNEAATSGGGVYADGAMDLDECALTYTDITVDGNRAAYGAGYYVDQRELTLDGGTVTNNAGTVGGGAFLFYTESVLHSNATSWSGNTPTTIYIYSPSGSSQTYNYSGASTFTCSGDSITCR